MPSTDARSLFVIGLTLAVGLVLSVFPLPEWAQPYRPQWPLMVLSYWCMALPHRVGVLAGWSTGLLVDVMTGTLLGQHALGYAIGAYLVLSLHRRLRLFPWWQQAASVGGIFALDRLIALVATGATGGIAPGWSHWLAPVSSTLLWPWIFIVLRDIRRKFRVH